MNYLSKIPNYDGEINLLDLIIKPMIISRKIDIRSICIQTPLKFINDSGLVIGNEISYELVVTQNIGFCHQDNFRETKYPYMYSWLTQSVKFVVLLLENKPKFD